MNPAAVSYYHRLIRLKDVLLKLPNTELIPLTSEDLARFQATFPTAPRHLVDFFSVIGEARLFGTGYRVHCWMTPGDIYDPVTAQELGELVIVGVGSTGACEAYDSGNQWRFGTITETCHFEPDDGGEPTMIDFLERRYLDANGPAAPPGLG